MKHPFLLCFLFFSTSVFSQITLFEKSKGTESPSYEEGINWWGQFADSQPNVELTTFGMTDAGHPLHLVIISNHGIPFSEIKESEKAIVLINNAIHPGEPDGVDASMLIYKDLVSKLRMKELLKNCIVVCIPYYNIGGALNRNSHSRANQEGPVEYGFRGNAQNLDLNRDFIKCDSKNAISFAKLLKNIDPDVYVETHVSNGADYQYTMTYLPTQSDKLGFGMGKYLRDKMIPSLENKMKNLDEEMSPYVNIHNGPLKDKIHAFYDSPRYSTGLTTLHQTFGFITETHMLKKFRERVWATHKFLRSILEFSAQNAQEIKEKRKDAKRLVSKTQSFPIDWAVDTVRNKTIQFKGYEYVYKKSEVTGQDRLFYDRAKRLTKEVKYFNRMNAALSIEKPKYYILKKGFWRVADRLLANGVKLIPLGKDSIIRVNAFKIESYESEKRPYEKHYHHSDIKYKLESIKYQFRKGDYLIPMNTSKNRFIVEVLEPSGPDSYFSWNFFDAVLQQKEWYSSYVFEDKAAEMLRKNNKLKDQFENKKMISKEFASNAQAQLYWLYKRSPHYEKEHMRLPVFRID